MNTENYRCFLEAIGHHVIEGPSGYWSDVAQGFYESIPPSRVMTLSQAEIDVLFRQHRAVGLKYCAPQDHVGKPSWFYIREDKDYDLKSLHPKMRNKVRQGLRKCTVQPITFKVLGEHGLALNRDTLARQGRDDPLFSHPERWARLCQAGSEVEGAGAWGAFVDDQLAAYMITFVADGTYNILHQMSRFDLLKTRANNALAFVATREMLGAPGIRAVSYGQASIRELPGLQEYKVRLGYEMRPMRHVVVLHPLLRPVLLNRVGDAFVGGLKRLLPENDVIKRLKGTMDIARQSQGAGSNSSERASFEQN